jgi:hypothetical protein
MPFFRATERLASGQRGDDIPGIAESKAEAQGPGSRLFDRESGAPGAALMPAGPRLLSGYPGMSFKSAALSFLCWPLRLVFWLRVSTTTRTLNARSTGAVLALADLP